MDTFLFKLSECQAMVLKGFKSTHESSFMWLNDLFELFLSLFNHLHKYLVFDVTNSNSEILETCFLCTTQVTTCIKKLEIILKTEAADCIVLTSTRQFFLDRIIFCLTRLKETVITGNCPPLNDQNFTNYIDTALDMMVEFNEISNCTNQCEMFAEMMIKSKNIKQVVEMLLSQALAFMQVTLPEDKKAINALCQKVLKEAISLEQACSLSDKCKSLELNDRQLTAQLLDTALFQLENVVNESVLRLLYQIFMDLSEKPIQKIRDLQRISPDDPIIDELTADFDSITDRLVQIGIFALAFADNKKIASLVRSSLASLEALEPELIPSILSCNCDAHSKILEQHWSEEIEQLETQITQIIDSEAFCKALQDIIEQCLRTNAASFDQKSIVEVVAKSKILQHHLKMNEDLLNLRVDGVVKFYFQDFSLILKECEAAVDYIGVIDEQRIIKRIKILNSTLKKFIEALSKNSTNQSKKPIENKICTASENMVPNNNEKFFTSHNIRASTRSILYRTNDFCTGVSSNDCVDQARAPEKKFTPGRSRTSLRIAMFKQPKFFPEREFINFGEPSTRNDTMGLNITDILDQLTDLSSTLSEKYVIDSTIVEDDCKIIIKVKNP